MKALCICSRGNVRSVMLAMLLKEHCDVQAIAIGYNSTDTILKSQLMGWADRVFVLDEGVWNRIGRDFSTPEHRAKLIECILPLSESGLDACYRPHILEKLKERLKSLGIYKSGNSKPYQGV